MECYFLEYLYHQESNQGKLIINQYHIFDRNSILLLHKRRDYPNMATNFAPLIFVKVNQQI